MQINLSFVASVLTDDITPVPLEVLIALQAILVALLIPVAIMVFQEKHAKEERLPNWFTAALLSECAKPWLILVSIVVGSVSLFTYTMLPWISLIVYAVSCAVFIDRARSVYRWYKESISYSSPSNSKFIQNHIVAYIEKQRRNTTNLVYIWRETWRSRFIAHSVTPKLLSVFQQTLATIDGSVFNDLVRTLDAQILTGEMPIYAHPILVSVCAVAVYSLSRKEGGIYTYSNILRALTRRSLEDDRCDLIINEINSQLSSNINANNATPNAVGDSKQIKDDGHPETVKLAVSIIMDELFRTNISSINRIQFTPWKVSKLDNKTDVVSTTIENTVIREFKQWSAQEMAQIDNGDTSTDKCEQYTSRLFAIEHMVFGGFVNTDYINVAISLENALTNASSSDMQTLLTDWASRDHPYLQHCNTTPIIAMDADDIHSPTINELHKRYITDLKRSATTTTEIIRKMAPILFAKSLEIESLINKRGKKIFNNTDLSNDTICTLKILLSNIKSMEGKPSNACCNEKQ